jgi:hypothetical protein
MGAPGVQLVVCLALLWPVRGVLLLGAVESIDSYFRPAPKSGVVPNPNGVYPVVPPVAPERQGTDDAATKVADIRTKASLALNFPALVAQLPYILVSPAKREWVPKAMLLDTWRALSWPFVGILFWWFLGRSIEAIPTAGRSVVHPRITWIETAFAVISLGAGLVALIGILTTTPDDRSDLRFMTLPAGGLLWGILATVILTARFLQWRVAKRNASAQATTDTSPG